MIRKEMTKTRRRRKVKGPKNMALKVAIVSAGWTNRKVSRRTGIGEVRLSAIINGYAPPVSPYEKEKIARCLNVPIASVFADPTSDSAPL